MSYLHWSAGDTRLKSYAVNTRQTAAGPETTLKIELTTRNAYELADLLRQLASAQAEQAEAERPAPPLPQPRTTRSKPGKMLLLAAPPKALPAPLKQIPHFKD